MNPSDTTALITGAGRRIGAACALALANQGARVVIHSRNSSAGATALCEQIRKHGGKAGCLEADLASPTEAAGLMERTRQRFGPVTILVNNAAIFEPGTLDNTTIVDWNRHLGINLTAPFLLMQSFARQLPSSVGKIINLIDQRVTRPQPGHAAYTVAKSALWTLTRLAALELAPQVQVNAIGPGPILPAPGSGPEGFHRVAAATPLARPGLPEDITAALLFLIRQDYITGEMIRVDGGEHL